jgi:hypothetical protein
MVRFPKITKTLGHSSESVGHLERSSSASLFLWLKFLHAFVHPSLHFADITVHLSGFDPCWPRKLEYNALFTAGEARKCSWCDYASTWAVTATHVTVTFWVTLAYRFLVRNIHLKLLKELRKNTRFFSVCSYLALVVWLSLLHLITIHRKLAGTSTLLALVCVSWVLVLCLK